MSRDALSTSRRDRLAQFIRERIESTGKDVDGELQGDTSLIRSQRLDSLGLLHLAVWVEDEIGKPLDVTALDLAEEWDTIADIERFIEAHR